MPAAYKIRVFWDHDTNPSDPGYVLAWEQPTGYSYKMRLVSRYWDVALTEAAELLRGDIFDIGLN